MTFNGVIGGAYNFELKKFSTEDDIYQAALKVINNIATVDQIYGIIQPFGWQAKVSGSI